jgi:hypothetical protein
MDIGDVICFDPRFDLINISLVGVLQPPHNIGKIEKL